MKLTDWYYGMKLTDRYDGDIKPVRVGVYPRDYSRPSDGSLVGFCLWNGQAWSIAYDDVDSAYNHPFCESAAQNLPWRGIAK